MGEKFNISNTSSVIFKKNGHDYDDDMLSVPGKLLSVNCSLLSWLIASGELIYHRWWILLPVEITVTLPVIHFAIFSEADLCFYSQGIHESLNDWIINMYAKLYV